MSSTSSVTAGNSPYRADTSSRIDRYVARTDADGNGTISLSEFACVRLNLPTDSATSTTSVGSTGTTDRASLFKQIDADGDGQLTGAELTSFQQAQVAAAKSALLGLQDVFGGPPGGHGVGGRQGHRGHYLPPAPDGVDANRDGTDVTASTPTRKDNLLDALFKTLDANGDGAVSKTELSDTVSELFG